MKIHTQVEEWLLNFAECVRKCDYDQAIKMFEQNTIAFDTVARRIVGLFDLLRYQWKRYWPFNAKFVFLFHELDIYEAGEVACVAVTWRSTGYRFFLLPHNRRGRASLFLKMSEKGWRCFHSHFSVDP